MEPMKAKFALLSISVLIPFLLIILGAVFNFGGIVLILGALIWMGSTLIIFLPFLEEEQAH